MASKRVHYIDWLRVLAVLLLIPFHSARVFDVWEPFYAKASTTDMPLSLLIAFINVWHMPLLFVLAGASTWFALGKRTGGQYVGERLTRLGVPLLFGTLLIVPPQMWYGAMTNLGYTGSLAEFWPRFFVFRFDRPDYFGQFSPAHLWFILFLLVLSIVALPAMLPCKRREGGGWACALAKRLGSPAWWIVPPVALLLAEGLPDIAGKNPFTYLVFFLLGFMTMADARFMESVERHRVLALVLGLAGVVLTVALWIPAHAAPDPSLPRAAHGLLQMASAWVAVLACLGFGKRYLDRTSPALAYAGEASYPFYILHQTVIVALGFYLVKLGWPALPTWLLLMASATAATLALYEGVRRTRVTRFLFGMKPLARAAGPADRASA